MILTNILYDVIDFNRKTDSFVAERLGVPDTKRVILRHSLVKEEMTETLCALSMLQYYPYSNDELINLADGIADSIYVLIGACVEFGIPIEAVWKEVHKSNMLKAGGPRRADGKILKPDNWTPPDIKGVLGL